MDGYLEPVCKAKNVAISRPRELPAIVEAQSVDPQSVIVTDEEYRVLYTGGTPLLVYDSDTDEWLQQLSLGGTVRCAPGRPRPLTSRTYNFRFIDDALILHSADFTCHLRTYLCSVYPPPFDVQF